MSIPPSFKIGIVSLILRYELPSHQFLYSHFPWYSFCRIPSVNNLTFKIVMQPYKRMPSYHSDKIALSFYSINTCLQNPSIYYFAVVAASVVSAAVVGSEPSLTITFSAIYFELSV